MQFEPPPPQTPEKTFMSALGLTKVLLIWSGFSMQTQDSGVAGRAYCTTPVESDWTRSGQFTPGQCQAGGH